MPKKKSASSSPPTTARRQGLPDLRALETFVAVCGASTMGAAAKQLGISQSAVSQAVRVLEAEQGMELFDREVRPARPTRAGLLLLQMAEGLLADARRLSVELRHASRQDSGTLRLGCVDSFAATVGPGLIRALSDRAQRLQLWSGLTPALNAQLLGRELDLAICTDLPLGEPRISQRPLFTESWIAVFPRAKSITPMTAARQLASRAGELPLIRYTQRSVIGQQVERFLLHLGLEAPRRFEFDATDAMLSLVAAGLGWAVTTPLCLWQSRAWLDEIQLVPIPAARLGQRDFYLLCRDAEWAPMADELAHLTRSILLPEMLRNLKRTIPTLPAGAISISALSTRPRSLK